MQFKPFRPPAFLAQPAATATKDDDGRTFKKRRLSNHDSSSQTLSSPSTPATRSAAGFRAPLSSITNIALPVSTQQSHSPGLKLVYNVLWRQKTAKMHKTWDGDGTLIVADGYASLKNEKGKYLGRTVSKTAIEIGDLLSISGMDVEIDSLASTTGDQTEPRSSSPPPPTQTRHATMKIPTLTTRPTKMPTELLRTSAPANSLSAIRQGLASDGKPKRTASSMSTNSTSWEPQPKHDPYAENALVMKRPKAPPQGQRLVDVVVDPFIGRKLRAHQREGVAFMYECVMGLRCKEGDGAILADEMGLGKSLQTIALLWTLLKQNPIYGAPPVVRKAIIICPASVVKNWRKEFRKWLGPERVGVLALSEDQKRISSFVRGRSYQVLVLSYEMFNSAKKDLEKCEGIDIIIADEGHRLKTAKNKTIAAVNALNIEKRIVLTGTLLQNDYSEWYSVVDFVNPGLLGKYSTFKKDFENPILRSRQQKAGPEDIEKGEEADKELRKQTSAFILRRTSEILAQYLPGKTEYVVLCRPTEFQAEVYQKVLGCGALNDALGTTGLRFPWINILKKVCNSPSLLAESDSGKEADTDTNSLLSRVREAITIPYLKASNISGKTRTLDTLLHVIHTTTDEKVVLMSNYTTTLDVLQKMLTAMDYPFLRLDGSTPTKQRQDLVDTFNTTPQSRNFVFLMSTKAGSVGINLIGASRLILFDVDWNPAVDAQAMARICRDGQKRPCVIYRLVTKGAIEERIFQRQVVKLGLADAVVDGRTGGADSYSNEEVKDLFTFDADLKCRSHEVLGCECAMDGRRMLRGNQEVEEVDVIKEEDDDDLDGPTFGMPSDFRRASQLDPDDIERGSRRARSMSPRKKDVRGLMLYTHLDARRYRQGQLGKVDGEVGEDDSEDFADVDTVDKEEDDGEGVGDGPDTTMEKTESIRDPILRRVVLEQGSQVDFIFAKATDNATRSSDTAKG